MTFDENQMAAIAAGLWEPGQPCVKANCRHPGSKHPSVGWAARCDHDIPCPDMRLPENLWRAVENRKLSICNNGYGWQVWGEGERAVRPLLAYAVLDALVALYKAEHPDAK